MNDCFENFGNCSNFNSYSQQCEEAQMINCRSQYFYQPTAVVCPQFSRYNSGNINECIPNNSSINNTFGQAYQTYSRLGKAQEAPCNSTLSPMNLQMINNRWKASSPVITLVQCMPISDDEQDENMGTCKNALKSKLSFKSKPFVANKSRKCSQDTKAYSEEDGESSVKSDDIVSLNNTVSKIGSENTRINQVKAKMGSDENNKISTQIKFKTEICKNWQNGDCKFGSKCIFAHGSEELTEKKHLPQNYKTKVCKQFHEELYCPYGSRCQFIHLDNSEKSQEDRLHSAICSLAGIRPSKKAGNRLSIFKQLAD